MLETYNNLLNYILVFIVLYIIFLLYRDYNKEPFWGSDYEINILDTQKENKIKIMVRKILKDLNGLLNMYYIPYFITGRTLLDAVRFQNLESLNNFAEIGIFAHHENNFVSLISRLHEMGYYVSKTWFGYRISPANGLHINYWNKKWHAKESSHHLEDTDYFDYNEPFVDIYIYYKFGDKYVRGMYPNQYYLQGELMPFKSYWIYDFKVYGPNVSDKFLKRAYGDKLMINRKLFPLTRNKVYSL